jgi:hypothetical protein
VSPASSPRGACPTARPHLAPCRAAPWPGRQPRFRWSCAPAQFPVGTAVFRSFRCCRRLLPAALHRSASGRGPFGSPLKTTPQAALPPRPLFVKGDSLKTNGGRAKKDHESTIPILDFRAQEPVRTAWWEQRGERRRRITEWKQGFPAADRLIFRSAGRTARFRPRHCWSC